MTTLAIVTCARFPDLWVDDRQLRDALRDRGARVDVVRWDDPAADWPAYDLVVIRSPWDYIDRRDAFVAWAHRVPRLANPADILEWNTDKRYLAALAAAGVPITPTTFVAPGETWVPPAGTGEWVVKPAISAGSRDTGRYPLPGRSASATAHVERLLRDGRVVMVQPYLAAVDSAGETGIIFTPDASGTLAPSHAVRKGAMLSGGDTGPAGPDLGTDEEISARVASAAEIAVAGQALAAVPGGPGRLLYARVDLIPGPDGDPLLVELELTEPGLFFLEAPGSAVRLADAVLARTSA